MTERFLRQLFELAEAVDYEGNFLTGSDRFVGYDLSGFHFADLRIACCLELGYNLLTGQAISGPRNTGAARRPNASPVWGNPCRR
jgi:hypothetical protein